MTVRLALAALRLYKLCISPFFRGSCRFLPSCADYAAQAVERFGVCRGGWLAVARLARCHPLCRHGHDPVPNRFQLWPDRPQPHPAVGARTPVA